VILISFAVFTKNVSSQTSFENAWNEYVDSVTIGNDLQEACVPRKLSAETETKRGVVVLFHGFSACPQQWDLIAPLLTEKGFDVLMPLNPGHGNSLKDPGSRLRCLYGCDGPTDNVTGFPVIVDEWIDYVNTINNIVSMSSGYHAVGGLSVGGTLAASAGLARNQDGTHIYSRQLIMNPMIELHGIVDTALSILSHLPYIKDDFVGWGPGCREERANGRGGVCTFKVVNGKAARDFGQGVLSKSSKDLNSTVTTAVLYDRNDPVVNVDYVRKLASHYPDGGVAVESNPSRRLTHCVLNFTDHSMLSRWDEIHNNKWWMNELTCKVVSYLSFSSEFFHAIDVTDPESDHDFFCELNCTSETCSYNRNASYVTC